MLATQKGRSKPVLISSKRWLRLIPPPDASAAIALEVDSRQLKVEKEAGRGDAAMPVRKLRPMKEFEYRGQW